MSATLRDVAREAGVSIRTVSRVVNNKAEIADDTRQRVLAVINRLGYRPNVLARGLVSGKTRSIAVVIPQITDPFYPEVVQGVESVARKVDYHVFLCNTDEDPIQEYKTLEALAGKQVEGVILCGTRMSNEQLLQANRLHKLVVVTSRPPTGLASINVHEQEGLATITTHLIDLGHRHIGHIARVQHERSARFDGYQQALMHHGLPTPRSYVKSVCSANIESGRLAVIELLQRAPMVTAITCYNDLLAIGAIQACTTLGRAVPDDISIVGFDDIPLASLIQPPLTTMHVPRFRLGQMATEQLIELLPDHHRCCNDDWVQTDQLPTELIIRASSSQPTIHSNKSR